MRLSKSTVALFALPATTVAVSLSDFTPRVANLPQGCKSVYTQTISGCSSTDFSGSGCSEACVNGLQSMVAAVKGACGNKGITGQNIIVAYLADSGPGSLCPNAAAVLGGSSSSSSQDSSATAPSTSTSARSSSRATSSEQSSATSTQAPSLTLSSTELSSTATASSLTGTVTDASSTGLLIDTSSTPSSGGASSTSAAQGNSQTNEGESGGGSPFDTSGNLSSMAVVSSISISTALLAAAMMFFAIVR